MGAQGDVIILGGGVIGLTTAYFLAKAGALVVVCERGRLGMEASWAGAGIIPPSDLDHAQLPFDRLRAISSPMFPALSDELKSRTGIDNGYVRCGGLEFADPTIHADGDEWYGLGVRTRHLSELQATDLEPAVAPGVGPAIEIPGMAQVRNPWHLRALHAACLNTTRVDFREGVTGARVIVKGGRVQGIQTTNEILVGGRYLVASGAWTGHLLEPFGCQLGIEPVRGQIALVHAGTMLFRRVLISGARYLVPRLDGRVLIGSTEEHVGYDNQTTAEGIRGLLDLGIRMVPKLAGATLEKTWAGLRPGSADGLPYIGLVPGVDNLYVAAGHFRAGIQLSPGTGLLLSELMLGKPTTMPMDAFRLDR